MYGLFSEKKTSLLPMQVKTPNTLLVLSYLIGSVLILNILFPLEGDTEAEYSDPTRAC